MPDVVGAHARRWRASPGLAAALVLSLSTAIWGASFVVAKSLVDHVNPLSVLALRFLLASVAAWATRPRAVRALSRPERRHAALIGVLLGMAQIPHYFGVRASTASAAAFLIGTYVVMTPAADRILFGVRSTRASVAGAVLALVGLAVFAAGGAVSGPGLALCLVAAVLYALQISTVGAWVPPANLWGFTTVTMAAVTVVVVVPAVVVGLDIPTSVADWLRLLYLALVAGVVAVAMQSWAQRRIGATQAAVILVMEPIWAGLFAITFTAEALPHRLLVGGAVLLLANVLVARSSRADVTGVTPAR